MKYQKYKTGIYKVINYNTGEYFFTTPRPKKKDLKILCDKEFNWGIDIFNEYYDGGYFMVERVEVYDLTDKD